jgi:ubiquinone/menaquinone biosynthesis C-methylase UbiE
MMINKTPQAFWDRVAPRYAKMAMRNPDAYETTLKLTKAHLHAEDRVLELGCGTGATALRLAPSVGQYVATDYSAKMIAIADDAQVSNGTHNITPCVASLGDGSLPTGPFDAVVAFNLLHLLQNRRAAFTEVFDLLRPGGVFISKTPCLGGIFRAFQPVLALLQLFGKAPDFNFITTAGLERDITSAGFEIIERGDYPSGPPRRFIVAQKPE